MAKRTGAILELPELAQMVADLSKGGKTAEAKSAQAQIAIAELLLTILYELQTQDRPE